MPEYQFKTGVLASPLVVDVAGSCPAAAQLLANTPPGAQPLTIDSADISFRDQTGVPAIADIRSVKFSAGTTAQIAILPSPVGLQNQITAGIDIGAQIAPALQFPAAAETHYAFLRWTYDVTGATSGSVALGGSATVTFGADVDREGFYALVRQIPDRADGRVLGCSDMLSDLIGSWRLPKQVTGLDSVPPGTWIFAETNGSMDWNLGVQYGYNLNWIRKATSGTLTGDIGLKLQMGLAASLSSNVSGKYAIVVSRGTGAGADRIALRLYRLRVRNWTGGVSASLAATLDDTLLPQNVDDLIAGALGISGTQIMKALKDIDSWTNPNQTLLGPLAGVTSDYLRKFFKEVTGSDLDSDIVGLKVQIQDALDTWNNLPQETTKLIWANLPDQDAISQIAGLAGDIGSADANTVANVLSTKLGSVPFMSSTAGRWLESLVSNDLFTALQRNANLTQIQQYARDVQALVDGGTIQTFLTRLRNRINTSLDLTAFKKIVNQESVDNLDQWLVQKLSTFVGAKRREKASLADFTKLRDQINKLVGMRQTLYAKAMQALSKTYTLSVSATYQSTTTNDALIDAIFDFRTNADDARACLASILNGNLDVIFSGNHPGMILNQGVLTHGIRRQSTVELTLPYFDQTKTHINDALASITAIDHGEGRLLAITAKDEVTHVANQRTKRDSTLSLALKLRTSGASSVVLHDPPTATGTYTLTNTFTTKSRQRFISEYERDVITYFPDAFAPPAASFEQYAADLTGKTRNLGKGTISLEVNLAGQVVLAWLAAKDHPDQTDAIYKQIARQILGQYRQLLLRQYFTEPAKYDDVSTMSPAFALLAYASVSLVYTDASDNGDGTFTPVQNDASPHLHWNEEQNHQLTIAMLQLEETKELLRLKLGPIQDLLIQEGNGKAGFYADDQVGKIIAAAVRHPGTQGLFDIEMGIALDIRLACLELARFLNGSGSEADVFGVFEEFASHLTRSFSDDIRNLWAGDTLLLPLGPFLLQQAAAVLDPTIANLQPGAMFTVDAANVGTPQRLVRLL